MIVLDEHILGADLHDAIAHWYPGQVTDITQLRTGSLIKDDAVPTLLRAARRPTFVTINVEDFWRRVTPHLRFCIVCLVLPSSRAEQIPGCLRRLFAHELFRTQKLRLGKIVRVTPHHMQYYSTDSWAVQEVE